MGFDSGEVNGCNSQRYSAQAANSSRRLGRQSEAPSMRRCNTIRRLPLPGTEHRRPVGERAVVRAAPPRPVRDDGERSPPVPGAVPHRIPIGDADHAQDPKGESPAVTGLRCSERRNPASRCVGPRGPLRRGGGLIDIEGVCLVHKLVPRSVSKLVD